MRLPPHETGFDLANSLNPARYRDNAGATTRNVLCIYLTTGAAMAESLHISWCGDRGRANELANFFARNVGPEYISHSELQGHRALWPGEWHPNLVQIVQDPAGSLWRPFLAVKQTKYSVVALIEGVEFASDSLLEESGFELLVPLVDAGLFGRTGRK
jgi:hypothetical protein